MKYEEYTKTIAELKSRVKEGHPSAEWEAFWKKNIELSQQVTEYEIDGENYARIPYGKESSWEECHIPVPTNPCHDCGIEIGQLHVPSCDMEECPKCHGQAISCGCSEEEDVDDVLDELEEIASFFRDTFRHNKTFPVLQEQREARVKHLEECISTLREMLEGEDEE